MGIRCKTERYYNGVLSVILRDTDNSYYITLTSEDDKYETKKKTIKQAEMWAHNTIDEFQGTQNAIDRDSEE